VDKQKDVLDRINSAGREDAPTARLYGTGIALLDYRKVAENTYEATRWVTVLYVPIIPGPTWLVRPLGSAAIPLGGTVREFEKIGEKATPGDRILKTLLVGWTMAILAVAPLALFATVGRRLTGPLGTVALIAAVAVPLVLLGYFDKRESDVYQKDTSE
jgi:hypothetical protein